MAIFYAKQIYIDIPKYLTEALKKVYSERTEGAKYNMIRLIAIMRIRGLLKAYQNQDLADYDLGFIDALNICIELLKGK